MLELHRRTLHAIATTVVPESSSLDERAWTELEAVIEGALAERDERVQRQLVTFLRLMEKLPILRYGQPLSALDLRRRTAFLAWIERSRFALIRRGFWGIRTLVFMGYYTRDDVADAIGYNAHPDGWTARGGTASFIPLDPVVWVEP